MADAPSTLLKGLTRDKLAKFLPNHQAIKLFEYLVKHVVTNIPDSIEDVASEAGAAQQQASNALAQIGALAEEITLLIQAPRLAETIAALEQRIQQLEQAPVTNNASQGFFPLQWPTRNARGNGSWMDAWVPQQQTFVDNVMSLRNQSQDAGGTLYGLAAICCLDGGGNERGAFGYSRNSALQPGGYTPDIVYMEFGDPFAGDANPSSFQIICTMAAGSAWFPGTTFIPMEHATKTGRTSVRARGAQPIDLDAARVLVNAPTDDGTTALQVNGGIKHSSGTLLSTSVALTNGAAASAGTLGNAPMAGNPTKWVPVNDNGTIRYAPLW